MATKQPKPGDELILHEGTYSQPCRRAIQLKGNVVWNCGEGIQVAADAVIRNNIIADSSVTGISVDAHAANPRTRNASIINNTIVGHIICVRIRWNNGINLVLANNAIYCPMGEAVNASGVNGGGVKMRANYVEGLVVGVKYRPGQFLVGGNQNSTFVNPGELNFWPRPKSALIGAADVSFASPFDFNNMKRRRSTSDVGAYDTQKRASNPGWKIVPGFKSPHTVTDDGKTSKPKSF